MCDEGWANDDFFFRLQDCTAHITIRNILHVIQVLVNCFAVVIQWQALIVHRKKRMKQRWITLVLTLNIVGQVLVGISGISMLLAQKGTKISLMALVAAEQAHCTGVICLVVTLLLPFKNQVSNHLMSIFSILVKLFVFAALPCQSICFILGMFSLWDETNEFNILILGLNCAVVIHCVFWNSTLLFSLNKVKTGIRNQTAITGVSPEFLNDMDQLRTRLTRLCQRLTVVAIILISLNVLSIYNVTRSKMTNRLTWVFTPINMLTVGLGCIAIARIVVRRDKVQSIVVPSSNKRC